MTTLNTTSCHCDNPLLVIYTGIGLLEYYGYGRQFSFYIASIASYTMQNDTLRIDGMIKHVNMWFDFLMFFLSFLFSGMIYVALIQPNAFLKMFSSSFYEL